MAQPIDFSPQPWRSPVDALTQGGVTGVGLGFQAQKLAMEHQQQALEQQKIQSAIIGNKVDMLKAYGDLHEKYSDVPSMQKQIMLNGFIPAHNDLAQIMGQHQIDPNDLDFEADQAPLKELVSLNQKLSSGEIKPEEYFTAVHAIEANHAGNKKVVGIAEKQLGDTIKTQDMTRQQNEFTFNQQKHQDDLEKGLNDEYNKQLSNRGGGLGLQDAKVNQAIHLRSLINQRMATDPKTGQTTYDIPENLQGELVTGLANLISGTGATNMEELKNLTPKTSQGDLKHIASYWLNTPLNISPQDFTKILVDSIDRQGQVSQKLRDTYHSQFAAGAPTDLAPERAKRVINAGRGARFDEYMPTNMPTITSAAQYEALQPGQRYIYNGKSGVKK